MLIDRVFVVGMYDLLNDTQCEVIRVFFVDLLLTKDTTPEFSRAVRAATTPYAQRTCD